MLSREKRLTKDRDFDKIYQKGKKSYSQSFGLNFLPNRQVSTRVGIVVGKKFSKKATERNKAKRVFREAVAGIYPKVKNGYDIIIFVKKTEHEIKLRETAERLESTLKKEGLLK